MCRSARTQPGFSAFNGALVPVTGGHTLVVVAIYAVIFAVGLTGWRDVTE